MGLGLLGAVLAITAPCARAFSLLGPYASWMDEAKSFRQPGGDIGGPMNIDEGYRWNVPVVTYGFDASFLECVRFSKVPWSNATEDVLDLERTHVILDEDHFGLEQVKERILEELAVLKLNPTAKAPILSR